MEVQDDKYECEIRWTDKAIPHIKATNYANAGFGQGFACSKQHIATLMDQIVKVRGERAKYFGAGEDDKNIISDAGYLLLGLRTKAEKYFDTLPEDSRKFLLGYAAGVNCFLENARVEDFPAWVQGAEWIKPISEFDLVAFCTDIALAAGSRNLIPFMSIASPPDENGPRPTPPVSTLPSGGLASNGWAIGKDLSYNGKGMVLGNPHFPWVGENRFWECHLTIEGLADCYGVTLIGAPGILIGFNENVAWTHTFSIGKRFLIYKLNLVKDKPDHYYYGDEIRKMDITTVRVDVLGQDGISTVEKQMYSSHYGPMLNLPILGWTNDYALTVKDANEDNSSFIPLFMKMDASKSLEEFKEAHRTENGMPWANTIAADKNGDTWYIDSSRTVNLSDRGKSILKEKLETDPLTKMLYDNKITLLDGSDPDCDCAFHSEAPALGLIPYSDYPQISRTDFVFNANDSAWLTNPNKPIKLSTYLQGLEEPPTVRTKACLRFLMSYEPNGKRKMSTEDMISYALSNKSLLAELIKDQLGDRCLYFAQNLKETDDVCVDDLNSVANILKNWDGCFDLNSKGAVLFREIVAGFELKDLKDQGRLFQDSYDPNDPFRTPRIVVANEQADTIKDVVCAAIKTLKEADIGLDSSLEKLQYANLSGGKYYLHGGHETDGLTNIVTPVCELPFSSNEPREDLVAIGDPIAQRTNKTGIRKSGYAICQGTSFFYALSFTDDGPQAFGLLTYGQDENINSVNHSDQIQLYIDKNPRKLLYSEGEILGSNDLTIEFIKN